MEKLELNVFENRADAAKAHTILAAGQQAGGQGILKVPPLAPPPMEKRQMRLHVCHVVSPQKFWVTPVELRNDLARLNRLLVEASRAREGAARPPAQAVPGGVYLAPYKAGGGEVDQARELVLYRWGYILLAYCRYRYRYLRA